MTAKKKPAPEVTPAEVEEAPASVLERLAKKATHCPCGAPTTTGECEHPEIDGEDVMDLQLSELAPLIHGRTDGYWRFKSGEGESQAAQFDLREVIARYADGAVRIWTPKQPRTITVVPITNLKMMRIIV